MSTIGGVKRESTNTESKFNKKVGLFEANVIAINPTNEEYKDVLGIELGEDSKATNYLGETKDGNTYLRVDVWLQEVKNKENFKVSFFLEDRERENRDQTKKQYINSVGMTSWADDENNLFDWFKENREYRVAFIGEEDLYDFLRTWLGQLDYRKAETTLALDWPKLMRGNVKDLKDIPDNVKNDLEIIPASHVNEVLKVALESDLKPLSADELEVSSKEPKDLTSQVSGDVTH